MAGKNRNQQQTKQKQDYAGGRRGSSSPSSTREGKRSVRRRRRIRGKGTLAVSVIVLLLFMGLLWGYNQGIGPLSHGLLALTEAEETIPDSLLEFAEKYPEAEDFVNDYPDKKNKIYRINLSSEVTKGTIPLFIQWDERWGYQTYGSNCMGLTGCGPTCLSMIFCGLTGKTKWSPLAVAQYAENRGYYVWGEGTSWTLMTTGAEDLGLTAEVGTVSAAYIRENLSEATPMIASMYPGDFTYTGHFIVLVSIDEEDNVTVNDPNSPNNSARTWTLDELLPQMRAVWKYSVSE